MTPKEYADEKGSSRKRTPAMWVDSANHFRHSAGGVKLVGMYFLPACDPDHCSVSATSAGMNLRLSTMRAHRGQVCDGLRQRGAYRVERLELCGRGGEAPVHEVLPALLLCNGFARQVFLAGYPAVKALSPAPPVLSPLYSTPVLRCVVNLQPFGDGLRRLEGRIAKRCSIF